MKKYIILLMLFFTASSLIAQRPMMMSSVEDSVKQIPGYKVSQSGNYNIKVISLKNGNSIIQYKVLVLGKEDKLVKSSPELKLNTSWSWSLNTGDVIVVTAETSDSSTFFVQSLSSAHEKRLKKRAARMLSNNQISFSDSGSFFSGFGIALEIKKTD